MKRPLPPTVALVAAVAAAMILAGACRSDDNSPQRANTGDTLERPTSSGPSSTATP